MNKLIVRLKVWNSGNDDIKWLCGVKFVMVWICLMFVNKLVCECIMFLGLFFELEVNKIKVLLLVCCGIIVWCG